MGMSLQIQNHLVRMPPIWTLQRRAADMALLSPVTETTRGLKAFPRGLSWLKAHPKYLGLLFIPMTLGLLFVVWGMGWFMDNDQTIMEWVLFAKPQAWWALSLYYMAYVLLYISVLVLSLLGAFMLMNVLASPIYEWVSVAVERDLTGVSSPELSLVDNLKIMLVELKKVGFILGISFVLLFIPMVNVLSVIVTAFLVGWDFFDYPLSRRNWSFRERLQFVGGEFWAVTGFGLWLAIPFAQFFIMPLAVAGGTILNIESLKKHNLLKEGKGYERR